MPLSDSPLGPRDAASVLDILLSARLARDYVAGTTWEAFVADRQRQDAVVRRLEVVGEAARRVSEGGRAALPGLPWRQMVGMRNRMIHEYDRVDLAVVWETLERDLPPLIAALEGIVPRPSPTADADPV
jgi:uncharacterized protein with HEPN domain